MKVTYKLVITVIYERMREKYTVGLLRLYCMKRFPHEAALEDFYELDPCRESDTSNSRALYGKASFSKLLITRSSLNSVVQELLLASQCWALPATVTNPLLIDQ